MSSPITLHPAPGAGFDEPFEMLAACHERVERMLRLLQRLAEHLATNGNDEPARQAARDVMRYFDVAGPAHHEDEERHVFPPLLAGADTALATLVRRLQQDHLAMAPAWAALRAQLARVAEGGDATPPHWQDFAALYRAHIEAEDGMAYPAAQRVLGPEQQAAMGHEMAQRRGVR